MSIHGRNPAADPSEIELTVIGSNEESEDAAINPSPSSTATEEDQQIRRDGKLLAGVTFVITVVDLLVTWFTGPRYLHVSLEAGFARLLSPSIVSILVAALLEYFAHYRDECARKRHGKSRNGAKPRNSEFFERVHEEVPQEWQWLDSKTGKEPDIPPPREPSEEYLNECTRASGKLESSLQTDDAKQMASRAEYLKTRFGLSWDGDGERSTASPVQFMSSQTVVAPGNTAAIKRHAKILRSLVMRYPNSSEPLGRTAFKWAPGKEPLRLHGKERLNEKLKSWMDDTTSAADSALFSSMGAWISPRTPYIMMFGALAFVVWLLYSSGMLDDSDDHVGFMKWKGENRWHTFPLGQIVAAGVPIILSGTAICLWIGRRPEARKCWKGGFLVLAVLQVIQTVFIGCTCAWVYSNSHEYDWTLTVSSIFNVIICLLMFAVGTDRGARHTFFLVFVAVPVCFLLESAFRLVHWKRFHKMSPFNQALSAGVSSVGFFLWRRRRRATQQAFRDGEKDAKRYDDTWEALQQMTDFNKDLAELEEAWRRAMKKALHRELEQRGADTMGELFEHADLLNDPLQAKFRTLSLKPELKGAQHYPCDVKQEARALQKVHRTYGGEERNGWRKLTDLCRTSLVLPSLKAMAECLDAITADPEIVVVYVKDKKMRIRKDYNAKEATQGRVPWKGGYRDVQLTVMLESSPVMKGSSRHCAGRVRRHLAEVQLHLKEFHELKTQGGGHKTYVLLRNMVGG